MKVYERKITWQAEPVDPADVTDLKKMLEGSGYKVRDRQGGIYLEHPTPSYEHYGYVERGTLETVWDGYWIARSSQNKVKILSPNEFREAFALEDIR